MNTNGFLPKAVLLYYKQTVENILHDEMFGNMSFLFLQNVFTSVEM